MSSDGSTDSEGYASTNGVEEQAVVKQMSFRDFFTDFMNLLKAFIGLNFMYISFAFSQAGLVRGILGLLFIAYITYISCVMLIQVKDTIPENIRAAHKHLTYGDIVRLTVGPQAEVVINAALVLTQFGYCTGYLIFLSHTIHDLLHSSLPIWAFVLFPLPVLIVIAQLRSVRSLGPFSTLANISLLIGFVSVAAYISKNFQWQPTSPSILAFPLFFGQVTAALEGIGLVIPVEQSMKDPKKFPLVMGLALTSLVVVLMTIGVLGFVTFGEHTQSIILLNMQGKGFISAVKGVLCLGILFTYPLQLVPVIQSFEGWVTGGPAVASHVMAHDMGHAGIEIEAEIDREMEDEDEDQVELEDDAEGEKPLPTTPPRSKSLLVTKWYEILSRFLIVLGTALVAVFAGKSFGLFQSLIGSLGASMLAYTAPSILHLKVFGRDLSKLSLLRNGLIMTVGILGTIVGTATTVRELLRPGGQ
mmetsp:Transcript_11747/g.35810  ORF Transcript_11747/g.35810 Transcript_11747/m.35810 type:complete len:473 (+) Transcript_11747:357-1775(+)|eukprot:CAMPEP_0198724338 /NCGR_PEP_ID=MMETSP1475-20131203/1828_1 /TAXON_ID= ORGANISM="Unidentified sp., Strain CCMP1999" /NCGR_SAMPLE_ID=MMETSP1475 /ASSEMBLY_ACC=CAM_ASM_001111 /LENGTH=472 /DNA_ID=CAMNT_0044485837 /DNA_START=187 /DNA_END=1605 /DNA_ORIENTATION=+